ncbi:MAG: ATPase, T2SS/T4P/T4SS family, partial [Burkholderiales bacterium]
EGHILIDQHGVGLHNLLRQVEAKINPVTLTVGDTVVYKYVTNHPQQILFWIKVPNNLVNYYYELANCVRNSIAKDESQVSQSTEFSILEYAQAVEEGYIGYNEIKHEELIDVAKLVEKLNYSLPSLANFSFAYQYIHTQEDMRLFKPYPGKLLKSELVKMSATKAETIISVLASIIGKFIHNKSPHLECQIPKYGHRFTGVIPPASVFPTFCIRKHAPKIYTLADFVAQGILQETSRDTIVSWIKRRFNVLIAGGTGSGKTTLANAILYEIAKFFPDTRLLIIEDVPELQFNTSRSVAFRVGEFFSMYEALRATLRFKPDRIVMGEIRGAEAYTLLKAWNTGHPGGLATIHANGVNEALYRFESCVRDHPEVKINRQELGFTINGIISIQNLTLREEIAGEYVNVVRRKVTALRQIIQYDPEKDVYQDVIYDKLEENFDAL